MAASNTIECMKSCVDKRIVGVIEGLGDESSGYSNRTFVFEDGTGFTFNSNGAFWTEDADTVRNWLDGKLDELKSIGVTLQEILDLAGVSS